MFANFPLQLFVRLPQFARPGADRVFHMRFAIKHGMSDGEISELTHIDPWFLDNLRELRRREFFFMALPFKCAQIDSAPARAIAIEEL